MQNLPLSIQLLNFMVRDAQTMYVIDSVCGVNLNEAE